MQRNTSWEFESYLLFHQPASIREVDLTPPSIPTINCLPWIYLSLGDGEEINSPVYSNLEDYIAKTNAEEKFKQINDILSIDIDENSNALRKRWYSLFSRLEKVEDVNNIEGKITILRGMYHLTKRQSVLSSSRTDGVKKVESSWGNDSD